MTNPNPSQDRVEELERALLVCLDERKQYARKLSQARGLLRDMMRAHRADIESHETDDGYAPRTWVRVRRFLENPALRKAKLSHGSVGQYEK